MNHNQDVFARYNYNIEYSTVEIFHFGRHKLVSVSVIVNMIKVRLKTINMKTLRFYLHSEYQAC